ETGVRLGVLKVEQAGHRLRGTRERMVGGYVRDAAAIDPDAALIAEAGEELRSRSSSHACHPLGHDTVVRLGDSVAGVRSPSGMLGASLEEVKRPTAGTCLEWNATGASTILPACAVSVDLRSRGNGVIPCRRAAREHRSSHG